MVISLSLISQSLGPATYQSWNPNCGYPWTLNKRRLDKWINKRNENIKLKWRNKCDNEGTNVIMKEWLSYYHSSCSSQLIYKPNINRMCLSILRSRSFWKIERFVQLNRFILVNMNTWTISPEWLRSPIINFMLLQWK